MVACDELFEPGAPYRADHRGHVGKLTGQLPRRRRDVDGGVFAPAELGVGVREEHGPQDRDVAAVRAQELLEQVGGFVELNARRVPAPVGERAALGDFAVQIDPRNQPAVAVAGHGGVEVPGLHRDKPGRAEQQVVDLAARVAVPAHQDPVVGEHAAEVGQHLRLAV